MTAIRGVVEKIIPDYDYQHANNLQKNTWGWTNTHFAVKMKNE